VGRWRLGPFAYWSLGAVSTVFGFLDLVAIGSPFLLTGVAMLLVGSRRRDRAVLWPVLIGVWSFVVGYVLVAPLGCTATGGGPAGVGEVAVERTFCTNVLGIDYSGGGSYRPPLLPALLAGIGLGLVAALVARRYLRPARPIAPTSA